MALPSPQELLEQPQPHHELLRNHCPYTDFSSFPCFSSSSAPQSSAAPELWVPFMGHARTQGHLHPAVPVLESPSLTPAGFPSHKLRELQTIPQEGERRKTSGKHRWENSSGHISTSWDGTGDTDTQTETFQRPFPPFPPHPSPKAIFQNLPASSSLARTPRGAGGLSRGYRRILQEHGASKSPKALGILQDAPLHSWKEKRTRESWMPGTGSASSYGKLSNLPVLLWHCQALGSGC